MLKSKNFIKAMALGIIGVTIANYTPVFAAELNDNKSTFTQEFLNASDDTIVVYMEGVPVKKSEIDANGVVKDFKIQEIQNKISMESKSMVARAATTSHTRTIPSGYNQAIVKTQLKAPQYSQTNIQYYFTNSNGAKFASGLDTSTTSTILATLAGFIPHVGTAITISFTIASLYKANIASKIRQQTDNGKKVKITEAKSNYGTFYGVFAWGNRVIETHKSYDGSTTETIQNLQYKK